MRIGVLPKDKDATIDILQNCLACAFTLYVKTLKFHWNVTGPNFPQFHALFKDQYEGLEDAIDNIAERVRQMGGFPIGSLGEFKAKSALKESTTNPDSAGMVTELLSDHEDIIRYLRLNIEKCDLGTQNFLTDLMQSHEKTAWMLRAATGEK